MSRGPARAEGERAMTYTYSFDTRSLGNTVVFKETLEFLNNGLVRLRDLLNHWNESESAPPYLDEVRDLDRMIVGNNERLSRDIIWLNDVSVGFARYLKA